MAWLGVRGPKGRGRDQTQARASFMILPLQDRICGMVSKTDLLPVGTQPQLPNVALWPPKGV